MDWFRKSKGVPVEEHRRLVKEAEQRVLELQLWARDNPITVETLDELTDAYEHYLKVATEEVEFSDEEAVAV
jgi:hypothetical protein